jgi:hypothetical protein
VSESVGNPINATSLCLPRGFTIWVSKLEPQMSVHAEPQVRFHSIAIQRSCAVVILRESRIGELERPENQIDALATKPQPSRNDGSERSGLPSREKADLNAHDAEPLGFTPGAWPGKRRPMRSRRFRSANRQESTQQPCKRGTELCQG